MWSKHTPLSNGECRDSSSREGLGQNILYLEMDGVLYNSRSHFYSIFLNYFLCFSKLVQPENVVIKDFYNYKMFFLVQHIIIKCY